MSARAIRKLREDRDKAALAAAEEDDDSDSEEIAAPSKAKSAFAMMNDSDSDSSEEEEEEEEPKLESEIGAAIASEPPQVGEVEAEEEEKDSEKEEENLDALLEEFKEQDDQKPTPGPGDDEPGVVAVAPILLQGIDARDLDVDHVMKTSLLSADPDAANRGNTRRRNRQTFLFGNPRDLNINANIKPPHFVGGGMGMSTYDRDTESHRTIPWPYNQMEELPVCQDRKRWYTFLQSDSYEKDCADFKQIQNAGDMNALVWFVAHHPFVTEALVTLGKMLYHANQAQEGLVFLRRSLWVYESATLAGFTSRVFDDQCWMDYDQPENQTYFDALFQLARVNNIAGLPRSSFAIARYLLSLDPLRDPSGILLALDCYALSVATTGDGNEQWLVDLVASQKIQVHYKDEAEYQCDLTDLPNWSYSYALALFRLNDSRPSDEANRALKTAIHKFPGIIDLLLNENDIDVNSRSCRLDWQAVLDYTGTRANQIHGSDAMNALDPVVRMATEKAYDLITRIFAKLNHKLWSSDAVLLWLHSNLEELKAETNGEWKEVIPLSPALMRYSRLDPGDYEMKFQLLPAEANPLDPRVVQHALVIDPNRRRLLRNQRGRGNNNDMMMDEFGGLFGQGNAVRPALLGPPTHVIDLDWPMLEIFWRSLLPWNRIDEIPRPR